MEVLVELCCSNTSNHCHSAVWSKKGKKCDATLYPRKIAKCACACVRGKRVCARARACVYVFTFASLSLSLSLSLLARSLALLKSVRRGEGVYVSDGSSWPRKQSMRGLICVCVCGIETGQRSPRSLLVHTYTPSPIPRTQNTAMTPNNVLSLSLSLSLSLIGGLPGNTTASEN